MKTKCQSGYALLTTMGILAVTAVVLGSIMQYSSTEITQQRKHQDSVHAFLIAEAGLEVAKATFFNLSGNGLDSFAKYYEYDNPGTTIDEKNAPNKFNFFSSSAIMTPHALSYNGYTVTLPSNVSFDGGTYDVTIVEHRGHSDDLSNLYARGDVMLKSVGTYNGSQRTVHETVRFKRESSKVFDYAYFINNKGYDPTVISNIEVHLQSMATQLLLLRMEH
jgi:hypothetical protein